MNFLAILLALTLLGTSYCQLSRSQPCVITERSIICSGPSITDASLLILKDELHLRYNHMYFLELHISDTEVTKIYSGTFADVQFENIYIQDNKHLTLIAEDAFAKQTSKSLFIINNPMLKSNDVYKVTDTLHVSEYVDLDFNALVEVPTYAFNEHLEQATFYENVKIASDPKSGPDALRKMGSAPAAPGINELKKVSFKKLVMSNNQIERINTNAFHLLEACNEIYLNFNKLQHIQTRGFNLYDHLGSKVGGANDLHLTIRLDENHLNKDSFETEFIYLNDHTNIHVNLTKNQITELKQEVWKPFLDNHNVLVDFTANNIECHSVEWLKAEPKLLLKTKGIHC